MIGRARNPENPEGCHSHVEKSRSNTNEEVKRVLTGKTPSDQPKTQMSEFFTPQRLSQTEQQNVLLINEENNLTTILDRLDNNMSDRIRQCIENKLGHLFEQQEAVVGKAKAEFHQLAEINSRQAAEIEKLQEQLR